jgi:hypothetical protein
MNFLSIKTSWSNLEFVPLKLCIASAYLIIGTYFHDFFKTYYSLLILLFATTWFAAMYLWLSKMNAKSK